ncbi:C5a anaphylatoxin chemotactic receptor 1-like isoform X3 [Dermochelys coriacea]|uniref:C5a anaphylatoxin chemotactic receptor 1-like isoform X3 n=1 Tax=Dermochelys coriacea TaxID=27794 RepID=UPI001CA9B6D5|nr:C5a anaphylatoxin chemotactic receptor 1-like isoform X3 [Dermochelys coriacea]
MRQGSRDDSHPRSAAVASPRLGGDSLALKPQQRRVSHWGRHRAGTQEIWLQLTALPQTPAEPWRRGSWRRMSVTELYGDYDPDSYPNFTAPDFDTLTPLPFQLTPVLWASLVLYSLVFLLGVPGNAAVIWVTGFRMKRTVNTVWFLNLAVADLLCCLALPFLAVPVARGNRWELGDFACKLLPSLTILNMFASVLLLTAISLDRCALVTKPVWCQNHRTTRLAWGLSGAAWLLALLMTLPTFIFRTTHHKAFSDKVMCVMEYAPVSGYQTAVEVSIATFRFAAGFLVPFVVIATCYSLVLARVQGSCVAQCHKPTVIVLVVIVGFFACWLPCHVVGLILATHAPNTRLYKLADATQPLVVSLAYVNSCLNPIIYVGMGQGFRGLVQSLLADILQEEGADLEGEGQVQFTSTGSGQATETTV